MKIKNSVQAISPDISIILMCAGILVACPLRIFQMLKNIDPTTGFFKESSISVMIFYGALALVSLLILVLTFLSGKIPAAIAPKGRRIFLGTSSIVFAATLFYDAISNYLPQKNTTATIVQNAQSLSNLHHAHAVFAFLASCYFVVFAISYFVGKNFHNKLKILSLAPLAWCVIKVLEKISVIISIVRVSELLLELMACVFLMLFFMTFARVVSDINSKGTMWSVIACGAISSLFILTYSIPRFMLDITGNDASLVSGYPVTYAEIACAAFIIVFIITTLRSGYNMEDVEKMNEELQAEAEYAAATEDDIIEGETDVVAEEESTSVTETEEN